MALAPGRPTHPEHLFHPLTPGWHQSPHRLALSSNINLGCHLPCPSISFVSPMTLLRQLLFSRAGIVCYRIVIAVSWSVTVKHNTETQTDMQRSPGIHPSPCTPLLSDPRRPLTFSSLRTSVCLLLDCRDTSVINAVCILSVCKSMKLYKWQFSMQVRGDGSGKNSHDHWRAGFSASSVS
jgi:hypothetical protein